MKSYRLHKPDGTPLDLWQCGACGRILDVGYAPIAEGTDRNGNSIKKYTHDERLAVTAAKAEQCCNYRCVTCGEKCDQFWDYCRTHRDERWRKQEREKEQAAFEAAVERTDYNGPFVFNDRYYADMEDFLDYLVGDGREEADWPEYLWVPNENKLSIDAGRVIESALDDHHEDAADRITSDEVKELQAFLDGWCERTGVVSYEERRKEYVRVPSFNEVMI